MEYTEAIEELKNKYSIKRNIEFSNDEFSILLISYPGFLVGNADNNFDEAEKSLVIGIVIGLFEAKENKILDEKFIQGIEDKYLREFEYLAEEGHEWRDEFLNYLTIFNSDGLEEIKAAIITLMKDVAGATDNTDEKEQIIIDEIVHTYLN